MKPTTTLIAALTLAVLMMAATAAARTPAPRTLAGFTLGRQIDAYKDRLVPGSKMCLRYQTYLHEVEAAPMPGFRSGLICVGNCARPGRIVRIKLKYADASKKFYDELLARFKKRFGKPTAWKGDAFGVMLAWKWSFVDTNGERISLTLQHNTEDREMKMGNAVKLALTSALAEEKACYEEKEGGRPAPPRPAGRPDWDLLVPH